MQVGVVFPTYEIGNDPGLIREFAQTAEELGYSHIVIYDHVLGAHPDRPEWPKNPDGTSVAPHSHVNPMHEAMVIMGYLAGATTRIGFITGVLVLPQRQTALAAKQAAELAVLRPGGLRLGVGTGWNAVEYEALNVDFKLRGKLMDEQVDLMRRLWAEDLVVYEGNYHKVSNAGINPRPDATIPVWFGGQSEVVLKRAARIGDGWIPILGPGDEYTELRDKIYGYMEEAGRDPATFGIEIFTNFQPGSQYKLHKAPDPDLVLANDPDRWRRKLEQLDSDGGVTHASLMTMDYGLAKPADHLEAIRRYAAAVEPAKWNGLA